MHNQGRSSSFPHKYVGVFLLTPNPEFDIRLATRLDVRVVPGEADS
jgi:hypothetical protein